MASGEPTRTEDVLDVLRSTPRHPAVFRGFGPLVVAAVLLVLMVLLLPSVAPEQIVERPVERRSEEVGE